MFFTKHLKVGENIDKKNYDQQKCWGAIALLALLLRNSWNIIRKTTEV